MCGEFDVLHMSLVHLKRWIADTFGKVMLQDCFCHITKMWGTCMITIALWPIDVCFMAYANVFMM